VSSHEIQVVIPGKGGSEAAPTLRLHLGGWKEATKALNCPDEKNNKGVGTSPPFVGGQKNHTSTLPLNNDDGQQKSAFERTEGGGEKAS